MEKTKLEIVEPESKPPLEKRPWPLGKEEVERDPLDEKIRKGRIKIYNGPK